MSVLESPTTSKELGWEWLETGAGPARPDAQHTNENEKVFVAFFDKSPLGKTANQDETRILRSVTLPPKAHVTVPLLEKWLIDLRAELEYSNGDSD